MGLITNLGRKNMISRILALALLLFGGYLIYTHFYQHPEQAVHATSTEGAYKEANEVICPTKEDCTVINACKCWCSHKCGPRDKVKDDKPVFLMSDPNGAYCYCNQWDVDNYDRCKVKENQANPEHIIKK
jgi:hypothetical protein